MASDHPCAFVVAALDWHKVAQQVPAQAERVAGPVVGLAREQIFLERGNLIEDEAGDKHGLLLRGVLKEFW